jgi:hypothetical protein
MNPAITPNQNHWYGSIASPRESGVPDGRFRETDR